MRTVRVRYSGRKRTLARWSNELQQIGQTRRDSISAGVYKLQRLQFATLVTNLVWTKCIRLEVILGPCGTSRLKAITSSL